MEQKYYRSTLHALTIALEPWENSSVPDDVHEKILELADLCFKHIGNGFTYKVISDCEGNIDLEEVDL
ncbi:hypothetical protein SAMN02910447_01821 [Ruminococcus sp. YE71]|nr:hypothetical protein SAMN02910446_01849 [Ruminococcus sp. YE78]SFW33269.1 hypothetical protein SAMN02910447_01821 [Ruminococcus sp. YE71]